MAAIDELRRVSNELTQATETLTTAYKEAERKTHAGLVLAWAARLEGLVQNLLVAAMRPLSKNKKEDLFEGYGPLHTFSAKIEIAYSFELIPKEIRDALTHVKNLRNRFAHSVEMLDLKHPKVQSLLQNIVVPTENERREAQAFVDSIQPMDKYLVDRATELKKIGPDQ